jgi:hypothetical protein
LAETATTAAKTATAVATITTATRATAASTTGTTSAGTSAASTRTAASWTLGPELTGNHWLARQETFALRLLASKLASAANGFGLFTNAFFRGLLEVATQLHFAEDAFTLHLLLERLQRLVNVIVTDLNEHAVRPSSFRLNKCTKVQHTGVASGNDP